MKYTYSIQNNILTHKLSSDRLEEDIRASAIVIALNHIDTIGDELDIYFNDVLSTTDKAILDGLVTNHSGISIDVYAPIFDAVGNQKVASRPDFDGSATWLVPRTDSGTWVNLCDGTLDFTTEGTTKLLWIPTAGKILEVYATMAIMDLSCTMDKTLHFIGANTSLTGDKAFDRPYYEAWDYILGCDEYWETSDHKRMIWTYPSPIILKSSANAKIYITVTGTTTGSRCYIKLKCISRNE